MTRKLAYSFDNPEKEYQAEIIIEPSLILKVFPEHENKHLLEFYRENLALHEI